jgi:hypothetical protein
MTVSVYSVYSVHRKVSTLSTLRPELVTAEGWASTAHPSADRTIRIVKVLGWDQGVGSGLVARPLADATIDQAGRQPSTSSLTSSSAGLIRTLA